MARYGNGMMSMVSAPVDMDSLESALRSGLARGDAASESVVPVLRHVLASQDNSLFGDEIIARVRGMLRSLALQLLDTFEDADKDGEADHDAVRIGLVSDTLLESPTFLRHLHGHALEWQLTQRIEARFGVDPVLTPLLQALVASHNADTAILAIRFLAAQARYGQTQQRMILNLLELPGDCLQIAMMAISTARDKLGESEERVHAAQSRIRENYSESSTRLGLASRLISALGTDALDALSIRNAGIALFLTAFSLGAGVDRDLASLSTNESHAARFALALRATGLKGSAVIEQCLTLHPDLSLPGGLEGIGVDHAAAILASDSLYSGQ